MEKKSNIPTIIFTILNTILLIILFINVYRLNILPFKYLVFIAIIVLLINIIIALFQKLKYKVFKIISYILFILIFIISIIGIYYTSVTLSFFHNSFNNIRNTHTNKYIVLTNKKYSEIYNLKDKILGYYKPIPYIENAVNKLNSIVSTTNKDYLDILILFNDLKDNKIDALLIEKALYEDIVNNLKNIDLDKYKTLYEYDLEINENINPSTLKDIVNIYISGNDFTKTNSDFNMIVTVNTNTKKILLTSIPRDYYVYLPALKMYDSLEYSSVWGINVPKEGLEKIFDINIDYSLNINTQSLASLVDAVGGVEFCSDISFTTTHALVLDTYDDTQGKKLHVKKGCFKYNGIETLTIARERIAFQGGDRQRQKNCQQIMINIFNKMLKFNTVFNYVNILDKLSDLYTTNIPDKFITDIISDIVNGSKYNVETQSVDGYSNTGKIHAGTMSGYIMTPYMNTVEIAKAKIKEVSK